MEDWKQKYEELFSHVRDFHKRFSNQCSIKKEMEECIPELVESEDERIRKAIGLILIATEDDQRAFYSTHNITRKECSAWLEKQKDANKAMEAVERIDKYIDEHTANAHDMKDSNPNKKYYRGWDNALAEMSRILQDVYSGEKQKEQNLEDIEDNIVRKYMKLDKFALANMLAERDKTNAEVIEAFESIEQQPAEWSEEDEQCLQKAIECTFGNGYLSVSDWLKDLPNRFAIRPKQEWSEEDEEMYELFSFVIELAEDCPEKEKVKNWIKEIKGRFINSDYRSIGLHYILKNNHKYWKPSEEQIKALYTVLEHEAERIGPSKSLEIANSLYDDLEKL